MFQAWFPFSLWRRQASKTPCLLAKRQLQFFVTVLLHLLEQECASRICFRPQWIPFNWSIPRIILGIIRKILSYLRTFQRDRKPPKANYIFYIYISDHNDMTFSDVPTSKNNPTLSCWMWPQGLGFYLRR